ncbi:MAG: undecaprenyldiphospho-muramoylpentapeptide beta-N-acetylglucosaminyltransferase [Armatimonadetes bacterium]|nr:undecaprenyldiphospho-muramoylpentapeptide beta-N-acetylglucosaminyltransferase [Armatimonadota bacterium]
MRVVITGGGTGGHVYPALSIARQLSESGAELLFIGSEHGPERGLAEKEGLPFAPVPSGPVVGLFSVRTARSAVKLGFGVLRAYSILRRFQPDVLIGTGGYTSAGVAFAEWLRRGRIIIHEQNSIPGRTNLLLAKLARKICVTFEDSVQYFPRDRTVVTGLPVRRDIQAGMDRTAARRLFGLDAERFKVLIFGGSQGARRLNEVVLECVPSLVKAGLQVLHQTGQKNYGDVIARRPDVNGYVVRPYIDEMAAAYSVADLVVSRSGASTIAEITVSGLPCILIPYPYAHAAHQSKNAEVLARAGAAQVVEERDLTGPVLAGIILRLAGDSARLRAMAEASKNLGRPDAAERIVEVVKEVSGKL